MGHPVTYALVIDGAIARTGAIPQVWTRPNGTVVSGYHLRPDLWPLDGWLPIVASGPTPGPLQTGTLVRTVNGAQVDETYAAIADVAELVNADTTRTQALAALTTNRDFLALASPTQAQTLAEVKALARQVNGLIRNLLGLFDGTN